MIFTKELLLKGLAGVSLCAGVAGLGIHIYKSGEVKINGVEDLGLTASDACKLPTEVNTPATCNITSENVRNIKFDGKSTSNPPAFTGTGTQSATLQISKDAGFPQGYLFTVSVPTANTGVTLTINRETANGGSIVINAGKSSDFKVKKTESGFSLEEAFTLNTLINKLADFTCTDGTCQIGSTAISIKQGQHTETKTKATSQTSSPEGKIKVYSGEEGYNKGFKFVIEEGDIDLSNGGGNNITKLEQFETYEIKKEGNDWILFRKSKASEEVKRALNLPTDCTMPESNDAVDCLLNDQAKLKAIKFEGKSEGDVTVESSDYSSIKLKISKTTETNKAYFPYGFKFVLESDKDITIPQSGDNTASITIMKNTNTEFKIKKTGEGKNTTLTLEKAWTFDVLKAKVGLETCEEDNGSKKCSFGSSINVYDTASSYVTGASLANGSTGKKMTYEEGMEGYSQGFKFTSAEDLTLEGGNGASGQSALTQISGTSSSYEIKEISGTWYLAKKTTVSG